MNLRPDRGLDRLDAKSKNTRTRRDWPPGGGAANKR
jgi:hypothetical protein